MGITTFTGMCQDNLTRFMLAGKPCFAFKDYFDQIHTTIVDGILNMVVGQYKVY